MFNKKITYLLALIYLVELSVASTSQLVEDNAQVALDKVNITCAMNLTCIKSVTNELVSGLNQRKSINFGSFSIEPVENTNAVASARSSKFFDLINGNAIKIPFGPVSLSFQRSADYENYMEVAVLRKVEGKV